MTPITLVMIIITGTAAASNEPQTVDLPVYDKGQPEVAVPLEQAGVIDDRSDFTRSVLSSKLHAARNILRKMGPVEAARAGYYAPHEHRAQNAPGFDGGLPLDYSHGYYFPSTPSADGVIVDSEDFASKQQSVKDNLHHLVAGIFQPKPLLDTILEHEKYGNTMDHAAGRAIVAGVEGVSNLVNSVLEVPSTILKKITKAATEKLNNLGGRLIGL